MNLPIELNASGSFWDPAATVLADSGLKGLVLLLLAAAVARIVRKRSAAVRHLNWLLALTALLLLPAVPLLVPHWRLRVLPAPNAQVQPESSFTLRSAPEPVIAAAAPEPARPLPVPDTPPPASAHALPAASPPFHTSTPPATPPLPAAAWLLAAWAVVALLVLAQLPIGLAVIAWRRRRATPLDDEPWNSLAANLARSLGLHRRVPLFISADSAMPMAAGLLGPAILLPCQAHDWSLDKRRIVLLHELAHVRRRDCLTHALAHAALALHWFNPLAWFAMRRLTAEREMACDDIVLTATPAPGSGAGAACPSAAGGEDAFGGGALSGSTYAAYLLEIARTTEAIPAGVASAVAVTMARRSQLEGRLHAILDVARPRHPATRRKVVLAVLVMTALMLPLASLRFAQAQPEDQPAPQDLYKPIAPDAQPAELTSDITGLVTDESGKPIAGAAVLALQGHFANGSRRTTLTDADGRFSFSDLKGGDSWYFSADHPRYAWQWQEANRLGIPTGPESLPMRLTLVEPVTLTGSVVNADGQGIAGVKVVLTNQKLLGDTSYLAGHDYDQEGALVARTDDAGRFTMQRLRPGESWFVLKHPEYALTKAIGIELHCGHDASAAGQEGRHRRHDREPSAIGAQRSG